MIAILTESFAGKWPFWLSPRQVTIVPIAPSYYPYAQAIQQQLHEFGIWAEADVSGDTLNKKVRNAELSQVNYIFVVGEQELASKSVNVRDRDDPNSKQKGETRALSDVIAKMIALKSSRSLTQSLA